MPSPVLVAATAAASAPLGASGVALRPGGSDLARGFGSPRARDPRAVHTAALQRKLLPRPPHEVQPRGAPCAASGPLGLVSRK